MESKKKKETQFNQMTLKQLQTALVKKRSDWDTLHKAQVLGKLEKRLELVAVKKDIARIKTFMTMKEVLASDVRARPQ